MMKPARTLALPLIALFVVGVATDASAKTSKKPKVTFEDAAPEALPAKLVVGGQPSVDASAPATGGRAPASAQDSNAADASGPQGANASGTGDSIADALAAAKAAEANGSNSAPGSRQSNGAANDKKIDTNKLPENEIPVLASTKDAKKSESNPFYKIIMTLAVLATALGAAAFGLKKMATRQGKKSQNTRIKTLTTHHLGPKKSLQIVQVAGETILIGVTDHNITMLKTLSLLDEEIPESLPQRFDHSMEDFIGDEDEPIVMRGLDQVRDTVSARLKNMRNL